MSWQTFLICLLLVSMGNADAPLLPGAPHYKRDPRAEEEDRLIDATLAQVTKALQEKYNIEACGSGVSNFDCVLSELGLAFNVYRPLSKEEIRCILVEGAQTFVQAANANEPLKKFMESPPFTAKNITLKLFIYPSTKMGNIYDPAICSAAMNRGSLVYHTEKPGQLRYESSMRESYEEALKIVEKSGCKK